MGIRGCDSGYYEDRPAERVIRREHGLSFGMMSRTIRWLLAGVNPADDGSEIQIAPGRPVTLEGSRRIHGSGTERVPWHSSGSGSVYLVFNPLILLDELAEIGILRTAKEVPDTVGLPCCLLWSPRLFYLCGKRAEDREIWFSGYGWNFPAVWRRGCCHAQEGKFREHLSPERGGRCDPIIVGIIPVVILGAFENVIPDASAFGVCLLLLAVGCAVYLFVKTEW